MHMASSNLKELLAEDMPVLEIVVGKVTVNVMFLNPFMKFCRMLILKLYNQIYFLIKFIET